MFYRRMLTDRCKIDVVDDLKRADVGMNIAMQRKVDNGKNSRACVYDGRIGIVYNEIVHAAAGDDEIDMWHKFG